MYVIFGKEALEIVCMLHTYIYIYIYKIAINPAALKSHEQEEFISTISF